VHVVDILPLDGSDPLENFNLLEKELKLYAEDVYEKPRIIVANKMDLPGANPDKVMLGLQQNGIMPEDWGGDVSVCPVSAVTCMFIKISRMDSSIVQSTMRHCLRRISF